MLLTLTVKPVLVSDLYQSPGNSTHRWLSEMVTHKSSGVCFLRQSEFGANCVTGFQELRAAGEFLDVTLACEEDSIDVHKLVLSANSSFFRKILARKKESHSYIYIRGLAYKDLLSMINFMYHGETKVSAQNLQRFIKAAQDLDIRGLGPDQIKGAVPTQRTSSTSIKSHNSSSGSGCLRRISSSKQTLNPVKEIDEIPIVTCENDSNLYEIVGEDEELNCSFGNELSKINKKINKMKQLKIDNIKRITHSLNDNYNPNDTLDSVIPNAEEQKEDTFEEEMAEDEAEVSTDSAMVIDGSSASDQNAQLELEISMRMAKIRDSSNKMLWKCKVCGKIGKSKDKLGFHVESHLNGFIHKCGICKKNFRTRNSRDVHQKYKHKKYPRVT